MWPQQCDEELARLRLYKASRSEEDHRLVVRPSVFFHEWPFEITQPGSFEAVLHIQPKAGVQNASRGPFGTALAPALRVCARSTRAPSPLGPVTS